MTTNADAERSPAQSASQRHENRLLMAALTYALLLCAVIFAITQFSNAFELGNWSRAILALTVVAGLVIAFNRLYLPITIKPSHQLEFASSPEAVWNLIRPRATHSHYRATVGRVEHISASPEIYRYFLRDLCHACPCCGLPHSPSRTKVTYDIEVIDAIENRLLMTRSVNTPSKQRPVSRASSTSWRIEPKGSGCVVTYTAVNKHPALWYWANTRFMPGNLATNLLSDLKSHLEGSARNGAFAAAREMLAFARAAPELCACSAT